MPFALQGAVLALELAGNGSASTGLGALQLQFESSAPASYSLSRPFSLRQLLAAAAGGSSGNGSTGPDAALAAIQGGQWWKLTAALDGFVPGGDGGSGGAWRADRITLGSCLQPGEEGCDPGSAPPAVGLCLDRMVIVSAQ